MKLVPIYLLGYLLLMMTMTADAAYSYRQTQNNCWTFYRVYSGPGQISGYGYTENGSCAGQYGGDVYAGYGTAQENASRANIWYESDSSFAGDVNISSWSNEVIGDPPLAPIPFASYAPSTGPGPQNPEDNPDDPDDDCDVDVLTRAMLPIGTTCYNGCAYDPAGPGSSFFEMGDIFFTQHIANGNTCSDSEDIEHADHNGCIEGVTHLVCRSDTQDPIPDTGINNPENCHSIYTLSGDEVPGSYMCLADNDISEQCYYDTDQQEFFCHSKTGDDLPDGCFYKTGYVRCYYYDDEPPLEVDPDSPDHWANGGNMNGDNNDDVFPPNASDSIDGGGFGDGGSGNVVSDAPTTSQRLSAVEVGREVGKNINPKLDAINDTLNSETQFESVDAPTQEGVDSGLEDSFGTLTDSTIVSSFDAITATFEQNENAACPSWDFYLEALDENFSFDAHCPIAEENRDLIGSLMFVLYTIFGFRKIFEA